LRSLPLELLPEAMAQQERYMSPDGGIAGNLSLPEKIAAGSLVGDRTITSSWIREEVKRDALNRPRNLMNQQRTCASTSFFAPLKMQNADARRRSDFASRHLRPILSARWQWTAEDNNRLKAALLAELQEMTFRRKLGRSSAQDALSLITRASAEVAALDISGHLDDCEKAGQDIHWEKVAQKMNLSVDRGVRLAMRPGEHRSAASCQAQFCHTLDERKTLTQFSKAEDLQLREANLNSLCGRDWELLAGQLQRTAWHCILRYQRQSSCPNWRMPVTERKAPASTKPSRHLCSKSQKNSPGDNKQDIGRPPGRPGRWPAAPQGAAWTPVEDAQLKIVCGQIGTMSWECVKARVLFNHSAEDCQERWSKHLDPHLLHSGQKEPTDSSRWVLDKRNAALGGRRPREALSIADRQMFRRTPGTTHGNFRGTPGKTHGNVAVTQPISANSLEAGVASAEASTGSPRILDCSHQSISDKLVVNVQNCPLLSHTVCPARLSSQTRELVTCLEAVGADKAMTSTSVAASEVASMQAEAPARALLRRLRRWTDHPSVQLPQPELLSETAKAKASAPSCAAVRRRTRTLPTEEYDQQLPAFEPHFGPDTGEGKLNCDSRDGHAFAMGSCSRMPPCLAPKSDEKLVASNDGGCSQPLDNDGFVILLPLERAEIGSVADAVATDASGWRAEALEKIAKMGLMLARSDVLKPRKMQEFKSDSLLLPRRDLLDDVVAAPVGTDDTTCFPQMKAQVRNMLDAMTEKPFRGLSQWVASSTHSAVPAAHRDPATDAVGRQTIDSRSDAVSTASAQSNTITYPLPGAERPVCESQLLVCPEESAPYGSYQRTKPHVTEVVTLRKLSGNILSPAKKRCRTGGLPDYFMEDIQSSVDDSQVFGVAQLCSSTPPASSPPLKKRHVQRAHSSPKPRKTPGKRASLMQ